MSFFERNRDELGELGIDPERLPRGQYHTRRFPVLHAGSIPDVDLAEWDFVIDGSVSESKCLSWSDFMDMPTTSMTADIHCVTKWTKFDTTWTGVPTRLLYDQVEASSDATHVMVTAYHGYTANLPLDDFLSETSLFAHTLDGEPLDLEHGYPLRLVVPHLYFWKSVKWVRGFTLLAEDQPGFWERNGYHMYGDPFREQRYWGD
jgi:DMSO/TMAO reductase YedYZ molybdopterin-dependent catalytic subunit